MRSKEEILTQLKVVLEEITLGVMKASKISDNDLILQDVGLDSLDYASALLNMEQWLGIHVREEGVDWRNVQSVEQLADFLYGQQR